MKNRREIQEQVEVFSDFLKQNRLKMTHQRKLIAETFLGVDGHLSTDELFQLAKKRDPKLGFATVFRTLKALIECGLARETTLNDGRTRFEHTYKRPHHHHIVCTECGRTIEFTSPDWQQMQDQIISQYGFKPLDQSLKIFGVCSDCQNKQKSTPEVFDSDLVFARDALQIAMETEKRGVDFYRTASETATNPTTKRTFLMMLRDERRHYRELKIRWDELIAKDASVLKAPVFLHFDYQALKRIFPSREEVKEKMKKNLSAVDALRLAMNMEREAHDFFAGYAQRFSDSRGRDIFLKFAEEEEEHYDLIRTELDRLTGGKAAQ